MNRALRRSIAAVIGLSAFAAAPAWSDNPGRGLTGPYEARYLQWIADHHYAELRITELAAGTDPTRDAEITPAEGTAPTPDKSAVEPKAASEMIQSMSRKGNRVSREEILTALTWLREWYGVEHTPALNAFTSSQVALLENAEVGESFDQLFLETLARHHYVAIAPSARCEVASELEHHKLQRYCAGIVHTMIREIKDAREMLCLEHEVCDYQPIVGLKGQHSGEGGQEYTNVEAPPTP